MASSGKSRSSASSGSTRKSTSSAKAPARRSSQASTTTVEESVAANPSPGGSELHAAEVEKAERGAAKADPLGKDAHPTAIDPSPGGSDMHAEAVRKDVGVTRPKGAAKSGSSPSSKGAQVTLRGRFSPGTVVQLVKVAGPQVLRTSPGDEVVEEKTVDENGHVQFSKGVEDNCRYYIRGYQDGFPLEIRVRGRAEADDSEVLAQDPVGYDDVKTRDGRSFPQRGHRLEPTPEYPGQA